MKRLLMVAGILAVGCIWLFAENVSWDTDPTAAGGQRRGILVQTPDGESLPVTGDITVTDATYSESIVDLTLTDTAVWYDYALPANTVAYNIKARTGYGFKVSKADDGAYQTIWAGDELKREVVNGVLSDTLYFNSPEQVNLVLEIRACIKAE